MEEILRFEHVSYAYEEEREALLDVCVKVCAGERVAVLGSNGAGKSTFFLLANGVLRPGAGRILFRGAPVGGGAKQLNVLRRGVGLVFQDPEVQLLGGSVEDEVSFGPMNLRLPVGEVRARVDAAIRSFALEEYRGRAPQYLSGGEKKRVTLADALAMEPQMLLLDEPAASLDPANTRLLEQNLQMLSAGPGAYGCNARRGFRMALGHPGAGVPRGTAGGGRGTAGDF
ncbi:MAG: energy-coupling factor ABC transporter ATP-binding protein [Ruthenibacterium lactatiformans]